MYKKQRKTDYQKPPLRKVVLKISFFAKNTADLHLKLLKSKLKWVHLISIFIEKRVLSLKFIYTKFSEKLTLLTLLYAKEGCVSDDKKCKFLGKFYVCSKWMILNLKQKHLWNLQPIGYYLDELEEFLYRNVLWWQLKGNVFRLVMQEYVPSTLSVIKRTEYFSFVPIFLKKITACEK